MKKLGPIGSIQITLIVCILISLPVFIKLKFDLNILAVIIAIISLIIALLNEVNKAIEANRKVNIRRFSTDQYNISLGKLLEKEINELRRQNKMINSIKIIDDKNKAGCSDVIIIYH